LLIPGALYLMVLVVPALVTAFKTFHGPHGHSISHHQWMLIFAVLAGKLAGLVLVLWLGIWLLWRSLAKTGGKTETPDAAAAVPAQMEIPTAPPVKFSGRIKHWSSCNILHVAPDAKRLWQFDARGKGFELGREQRVPHTEPLPSGWVAKNWSSLWQPKLNIAWLPSESVFLRVVELPAASPEETFSMVELQLEKLSHLPVTQIVWTMHALGAHQSPPKADGTVESLQTVIVVMAARTAVEEFMGRLERDGFLADRLEAPMLDQLEAIGPREDGVWLFPLTLNGQNAALVAWWFGGAWRNLSFVTLPPAGDRAAELKNQLGLMAMAGEVEGWLTTQPQWHLVADPVNASEWEQLLRSGLNEPVRVIPPPPPAELAARSARRAAASVSPVHLLPPEYTARYREQFSDRLWLHGLGYAGLIYVVFLVIYFCGVGWLRYKTYGVESQVAAISNSFTNTIQLKSRLAVLQERSQLKYAALDCWQLVAQELPPSISLARTSFANGSKLTLNGSASADDTQKLSAFYDALRKAKLNGQPYFNADSEYGDQLTYRSQGGGNQVVWSFSLELQHVEAESP
jgi:hypothetical protein